MLLPGFAPDSVPVLKLKEALEQKGYPAIATNFFGDAVFKDFSELTVEHSLSGIEQVINKAALEYDRVVGIGICLGGALLLEHSKTKNHLHGVVSIGTPFKVKKRTLLRAWEFLLPAIYPFWRIADKNKKLRLLPVGASREFLQYTDKDFLKDLEKISVPALFIHSKRDYLADYKVVPHFSSRLSSQHKKHVFTESGHHVMDNDVHAIINYAESFLKDVYDNEQKIGS